MSTTSRKERIREAWAAVYAGDMAPLDRLLSPTYRRWNSTRDQEITLDELKASILAERSAFPDLTVTIDLMIEEGDRVAAFWHGTGRHQQPLLGVPATNRIARFTGASVSRFEGDVIVDEYVMWDSHALLRELGIISVGVDR